MSFKDAIARVKQLLKKQPKKEENQTQKYKNMLQQLVDGGEWVHSTVTKGALPTLYIYVAPNANIDTVQGMYADLGIDMKKHVSHLDNKERTVLYISTPDFMKLNETQQGILKTPTEKSYKRAKEENQTQKYKNMLQQLVDGGEWVHSTVTKGALPTLYIYVAPNANIDTVQGMYADLGIDMKKHVSHLDNKERTVLYISTPDFMKLNETQQGILKTPTEKSYKRAINLSVRTGTTR